MSLPSSAPTERQRVVATHHALARARERHSDLRYLSERDLCRVISREVGEALRAQRVARNAPRQAVIDTYRYRTKAHRWVRFAWNASCSRVYVFKRREGVVLVVTTLATVTSQR